MAKFCRSENATTEIAVDEALINVRRNNGPDMSGGFLKMSKNTFIHNLYL